MNYKKILKRETKVMAYVVICLTVLVIGTSYALFLQVDNNTNNQIVEAGSLTVTYSGGNTITVAESDSSCLTPQSDTDGSGSGGCKFNLSITNTGTLPMQYNLLIYDNTTDAPSGATLVNHSVIRHSLKKQYTVAGTNETATEAASLSSLSKYDSTNKKILETASIDAGETITFALNIWIDESASTDIIGQYVYLKLDVVGSVFTPICKRATELHTEKCSNTDTTGFCRADGYASGATITYGSLGKSRVLSTGDAFDCDVNGDSKYDSKTERFYYVSDYYDTKTKSFDTNYATLIYYSDVAAGVPNTSEHFVYDNITSSTEETAKNYNGPLTAVKQLPTTSKWSNVSLKNTTRNILNNSNTTIANNFSYEGYAARLLTYQEIEKGCYANTAITDQGGITTNCRFLLENTSYSSANITTNYSWLETVTYGYEHLAYNTSGYYRSVFYANVSGSAGTTGVRPAIDVAKTSMNY